MMPDANNNGVDDNVEAAVAAAQSNGLSWKSFLRLVKPRDVLVGVIAIATVSLLLIIGRAVAPDSALVKGFGQWFAGGACTEIEKERDTLQGFADCMDGAGDVPDRCAAKLKPEGDGDS